MADLMSGTYTYEGLKKKYGRFMVPAVKIRMGGMELTSNKAVRIREVQADLSLSHAGSVRVVISQCYDYEQSALNKQVKSQAVLGNVLEAELGYGSDTLLVFKGYIAAVDVSFDAEEGIRVIVTALDVRKLMMTGGSHYRLYDVKKYSEAFDELMKPYKKLCTVKTDATKEQLETPLSQSDTDYNFVTKELIGTGRADREFFVLGDKAYFREPRSSKSPVIELGIGNGLYSFERSSRYINHDVEVIGYDPGGEKTVRGTAKAKTADKQASALAEPGKRVLTAPDAVTQAQADARAKAIAERMTAQCQTGQVVCIGLPQIVPGRFVKFVKLDSDLNRKYYVKEVRHSIDENGFVTSFEIEGWE